MARQPLRQPSTGERLAFLEAQMGTMTDQHSAMLKKLDELTDVMEKDRALLTRYKGFAGGAMFVVSALFMALSLFKEWIIKHI